MFQFDEKSLQKAKARDARFDQRRLAQLAASQGVLRAGLKTRNQQTESIPDSHNEPRATAREQSQDARNEVPVTQNPSSIVSQREWTDRGAAEASARGMEESPVGRKSGSTAERVHDALQDFRHGVAVGFSSRLDNLGTVPSQQRSQLDSQPVDGITVGQDSIGEAVVLLPSAEKARECGLEPEDWDLLRGSPFAAAKANLVASPPRVGRSMQGLVVSGQKIGRGKQSIVETLPKVFEQLEEDIRKSSPPQESRVTKGKAAGVGAAISRQSSGLDEDRPALEIKALETATDRKRATATNTTAAARRSPLEGMQGVRRSSERRKARATAAPEQASRTIDSLHQYPEPYPSTQLIQGTNQYSLYPEEPVRAVTAGSIVASGEDSSALIPQLSAKHDDLRELHEQQRMIESQQHKLDVAARASRGRQRKSFAMDGLGSVVLHRSRAGSSGQILCAEAQVANTRQSAPGSELDEMRLDRGDYGSVNTRNGPGVAETRARSIERTAGAPKSPRISIQIMNQALQRRDQEAASQSEQAGRDRVARTITGGAGATPSAAVERPSGALSSKSLMQIMIQRSGRQVGSHITPTSLSYELGRQSEGPSHEPGQDGYRNGPAQLEDPLCRSKVDGSPAMLSLSTAQRRRPQANGLEAHDSNALARIQKLQRAGARTHMGTADRGRGRPGPGALNLMQKEDPAKAGTIEEQAHSKAVHDEQSLVSKASEVNNGHGDDKVSGRPKDLEPPPSGRTRLAQRLLSVDYRNLRSGDVQAYQVLAPHGPADYHASRLEGFNNLKYDDTQLLLSRYMVRQDPHCERHPETYKHVLIQRIYEIRQNQLARIQESLGLRGSSGIGRHQLLARNRAAGPNFERISSQLAHQDLPRVSQGGLSALPGPGRGASEAKRTAPYNRAMNRVDLMSAARKTQGGQSGLHGPGSQGLTSNQASGTASQLNRWREVSRVASQSSTSVGRQLVPPSVNSLAQSPQASKAEAVPHSLLRSLRAASLEESQTRSGAAKDRNSTVDPTVGGAHFKTQPQSRPSGPSSTCMGSAGTYVGAREGLARTAQGSTYLWPQKAFGGSSATAGRRTTKSQGVSRQQAGTYQARLGPTAQHSEEQRNPGRRLAPQKKGQQPQEQSERLKDYLNLLMGKGPRRRGPGALVSRAQTGLEQYRRADGGDLASVLQPGAGGPPGRLRASSQLGERDYFSNADGSFGLDGGRRGPPDHPHQQSLKLDLYPISSGQSAKQPSTHRSKEAAPSVHGSGRRGAQKEANRDGTGLPMQPGSMIISTEDLGDDGKGSLEGPTERVEHDSQRQRGSGASASGEGLPDEPPRSRKQPRPLVIPGALGLQPGRNAANTSMKISQLHSDPQRVEATVDEHSSHYSSSGRLHSTHMPSNSPLVGNLPDRQSTQYMSRPSKDANYPHFVASSQNCGSPPPLVHQLVTSSLSKEVDRERAELNLATAGPGDGGRQAAPSDYANAILLEDAGSAVLDGAPYGQSLTDARATRGWLARQREMAASFQSSEADPASIFRSTDGRAAGGTWSAMERHQRGSLVPDRPTRSVGSEDQDMVATASPAPASQLTLHAPLRQPARDYQDCFRDSRMGSFFRQRHANYQTGKQKRLQDFNEGRVKDTSKFVTAARNPNASDQILDRLLGPGPPIEEKEHRAWPSRADYGTNVRTSYQAADSRDLALKRQSQQLTVTRSIYMTRQGSQRANPMPRRLRSLANNAKNKDNHLRSSEVSKMSKGTQSKASQDEGLPARDSIVAASNDYGQAPPDYASFAKPAANDPIIVYRADQVQITAGDCQDGQLVATSASAPPDKLAAADPSPALDSRMLTTETQPTVLNCAKPASIATDGVNERATPSIQAIFSSTQQQARPNLTTATSKQPNLTSVTSKAD